MPSDTPPSDSWLDTILVERYRLIRCLGKGAFGRVYEAEHVETGGRMAVKLLHAQHQDDPDLARRFLGEARHTARLSHPNTIRISDFGRLEDGNLYLVMEYAPGRPLDAEIERDAPMEPGRALGVTLQVLRSLVEAHGLSIVHRDIKPANVMLVDAVGEPDFVKVLDFGIAKALDADTHHTQGLVGTPNYMSPEQWKGEPVDGRADVYAVGCMLYEMLAGRPPFTVSRAESRSSAVYRLMRQHIDEEAEDIRAFSPFLDAELAQAVHSLLHKDPAQRPSAETALEVLGALRPRAAPDVPSSRAGGGAARRTASRTDAQVSGVEATLQGGTEQGVERREGAVLAPISGLEATAIGGDTEGLASPAEAAPPAPPPAGTSPGRWRAVWAMVAAALVALGGLALVMLGPSVQAPEDQAAPPVAPSQTPALVPTPTEPTPHALTALPPESTLLVMPLEARPERAADRALWPRLHQYLATRLLESAPAWRVVDPQDVDRRLHERGLAAPHSEAAGRELAAATGAGALLEGGEVLREAGLVKLRATLRGAGGEGQRELEARAAGPLEAASALAEALAGALAEMGVEARAPPVGEPPEVFHAALEATLRDPWSKDRYGTLLEAARASGEAELLAWSEALAAGTGADNDCGQLTDALLARWPATPLAAALCHHRSTRHEDALHAALDALGEPRLRRVAGAFASKVDFQSRTPAERVELLVERLAWAPDEVDAWWLLATLGTSTGQGAEEADSALPGGLAIEDVVAAAQAVSEGVELSTSSTQKALRVSLVREDVEASRRWARRLGRAPIRGGWDRLFSATLRSAASQLGGRVSDAWQVLEEARGELADPPGDPYTIVATTLLTSYLHFGELERAAGVASEYKSLLGESPKPDRFTARLAALAVEHAQGRRSQAATLLEATRLADALESAVGQSGRRERDAFLCPVLVAAGAAAEALDLARSAVEHNPSVGACRRLAGEELLRAGRPEEALQRFREARRDLLYRADWGLEHLLPAWVGEAQALLSLGRHSDARGLLEGLLARYRSADRDLPSLARARELLQEARKLPEAQKSSSESAP